MLKKHLIVFLLLTTITSIYSNSNKRFALVIGNANYEGIAQLKNPVNDANSISAELTNIGWDVTVITDANRREMLRAITGFRDKITNIENSSVMVYYAGHGMQIDGENYLLPVESIFETVDDVEADGIRLNYLTEILEKSTPDMTLIVLDACRDNPFGKTGTRSSAKSRGLSVVQVAGGEIGSAVIFATSPGDVALDGTGTNGVFTKAFLNHMNSTEKLEDVFRNITQEVRTTTNNKQTPWINASLSSSFYLISDEIRLAKLKIEKDKLDKIKSEEIAKATESAREEVERALAEKKRLELESEKALELSQSEKAKIEAELVKAKEAEIKALEALQAARLQAEKPKGKIRIKSGLEGRIYIDNNYIGVVSRNAPLISESLSPGLTKFTFEGIDGNIEEKEVVVTETAYSTIVFQEELFNTFKPSTTADMDLPWLTEDILVTLDGYTQEVTYNKSGATISNIKPKEYTMDIKFPDYGVYSTKVTLSPGESLIFDKPYTFMVDKIMADIEDDIEILRKSNNNKFTTKMFFDSWWYSMIVVGPMLGGINMLFHPSKANFEEATVRVEQAREKIEALLLEDINR